MAGKPKDLTHKEMLSVWKTRLDLIEKDKYISIRGHHSFSSDFSKQDKIDYCKQMIERINQDQKNKKQ